MHEPWQCRAVKFVLTTSLMAAVCGGVRAADPPPGPDPRIDELSRRVEQLERTVAEQQDAIRRLLAAQPAAAAPQPAPPGAAVEQAPASPTPPSELEQQLAKELGAAPPTAGSPPAAGPAPLTIVGAPGGRNYLNLSLDALMVAGASSASDLATLESGGHDPSQRGVSLQNVEAVFEGAVDPYFRGQANLVVELTPDGETIVELEEAYATTTALPWNLQVKAGQFLTEFGRLNPTHPHTWDFVDQPLVNGRMFGEDGLRSLGAQLSWLAPLSFYSELFFTVENGHGATLTSFGSVPGETAFGRPIVDRPVAELDDMLYVGRYAGSVDVTDDQTLVFGASGAVGPNGTGEDARTHIEGLDLFWKWKAPNADKGFPFVKVQAEGMRRHYDAAASETAPAATFKDWGAYGQLAWGFRPGWVVAARYDRVGGDIGDLPEDPLHEGRYRAAANLTWFPTEFSKLRLQYNRDHREFSGNANSLWLQFEFLLGAHAAHKF